MAVGSITNTLGVGSGIDTRALVDSLIESQFATRNALLDTREEALTARISAASELKNAIAGFSSALATLARGGSLATQPTSSDPSAVKVSLLAGGNAAGLSASVEVRQTAQAQATHSALVADPTASIGTGRFTLTFGNATVGDGRMTGFTAGAGTPVEIEIGQDSASLNGIAAAINAKQAGVTASILTDAGGARLVLKGATGESQGFTLTTSQGSDAGLAALQVGPDAGGTTIGSAARDAILNYDGVTVQRASNSIGNIVPGVRLDLVAAKPGTVIQLGTQVPTDGLGQAVQDFVATYNELHAILTAATHPQTGPLRADQGARALRDQLGRLPSRTMGEGMATLAELGVGTNRDGTLSLDTVRLANALASDPAGVEALFRPGAGLPAALASIATAAADRRSGLGASEANYTAQQATLAEDREKTVDAASAMRTRMTMQFASMDAKVAAYKSTQSFLEQQVDAWNNSDR